MKTALLAWFDRHARALPWRAARTPYRAFVAEIMLQQTQVATVLPYYERWLERFPTVAALAAASLDDVLKVWEGLGYYARARNLHRAAQQIAAAGTFPVGYEGWLALPGVGPYTAAALASVLDGEPVLAVDGNLKRVAARLGALDGDVTTARARAALAPLMDKARPGDVNEALMDLGARVCTPKHPRCAACPLSHGCAAYLLGRVADFPAPKLKRAVPTRVRYAAVDIRDGRIRLRRRGADEMLGGLWGFPLLETPPEGAALPPVRHAYTHFRTTVTPVLSRTAEGCWVALEALDTLALGVLDRKILARLREAGILEP